MQSEQTLDRVQGGLGIGLSVVRQLIEIHGGECVARSAGINQGSTFEITLPRSQPVADHPGHGAAAIRTPGRLTDSLWPRARATRGHEQPGLLQTGR